MTRKTRERIEGCEQQWIDFSLMLGTTFKEMDGIRNRLSALEDSLAAAELKIEQRKQENVYLNRLLDMLQHGQIQKGEAPAEPKPEAEETGNSWSE